MPVIALLAAFYRMVSVPMKTCRRLACTVLLSTLICTFNSKALINPRFTPVHLVQQSELILVVDLKPGPSKDQYAAAIREVLKGKTELKALSLDLSKAINSQNADALRDLAASGKPALFFVGEFSEDKDSKGDSSGGHALLHLAGQWAEFDGSADKTWALRQLDAKSQGIWAGGTDMLRRAVEYILQNDEADVPVTDGVSWSSEPKRIATLAGRIRAMRPLELAGDGKLVLFIACEQGDHLLACESKSGSFSDITASRQLQSKSHAFAWGDFSGNGRLDLISWDGKSMTLHAQQADGTFKARAHEIPGGVDGCTSLMALDSGSKGRAGVLINGSGAPLLASFDAEGNTAASKVPLGGVDLQKLGKGGPCLAADFDGDDLPDILQLFASGSVLFRGQGPGKFSPGSACAVKGGTGEAAASLADFDGDGRLDVLCVNSEGVRIWQNEGQGKFSEALSLSGEIAYISKPEASDCMAGDVNNDGRQDALIAYRGMSPHLFFNRGFRSFGHAHSLDLAEHQLLPVAEQGQQAACLGDFNRDGAQDMVLALKNGEVWVFYRENEDRQARSAVATLPLGGEYKGPVIVTGWLGKQCLGAWNVSPGTSQAFFGRREPGPLTLKWRLPGGKEQQKEVIVEKEIVRVEVK